MQNVKVNESNEIVVFAVECLRVWHFAGRFATHHDRSPMNFDASEHTHFSKYIFVCSIIILIAHVKCISASQEKLPMPMPMPQPPLLSLFLSFTPFVINMCDPLHSCYWSINTIYVVFNFPSNSIYGLTPAPLPLMISCTPNRNFQYCVCVGQSKAVLKNGKWKDQFHNQTKCITFFDPKNKKTTNKIERKPTTTAAVVAKKRNVVRPMTMQSLRLFEWDCCWCRIDTNRKCHKYEWQGNI